MGAGRRTETYIGSHPPTLSPDSSASFGPKFLYLSPQHLASVIFGCTRATIKECLDTLLFGLPYHHFSYVQNVRPGMPLFLFNYSDRKLHGIFEATSRGQIDINPHAWTNNSARTPYSAQVSIRVRQLCLPIPERVYKHAISANYSSEIHFSFELDETQTKELVSLFTSSVGMKPPKNLPLTTSQLGEEETCDGWVRPKKTIKSLKNDWQNFPPLKPATQRPLPSEFVSTEVQPEHWEDMRTNDFYYRMNHSHSLADEAWEEDHQTRFEWEYDLDKEALTQKDFRSSSGESAGDSLSCPTVSFYGDKENEEPTTAECHHNGKRKQKQHQSDSWDTWCNGSSPELHTPLHDESTGKIFKQTHSCLENSHDKEALEGQNVLAWHTKEEEKVPADVLQSSDWVNDRCMREQIVKEEESEQQRGSLQDTDSAVADASQINLESSVGANVLMKGQVAEQMYSVQDTSTESGLLNEVDQLRQRNAMLEHNQGQLVSEIGSLKLQMAHLSRQFEALQYQAVCSNDGTANNKQIVNKFLDEKVAAHNLSQNIYLFGGSNGESWLQNADAINPVTLEVVPISPMLFSRSYAAATVLMGQIYVFGGGNGELWYETAEYYDSEKNEWLLCSPMSIKRGSLAGATLGDRIYALGGGNGQINFSEVECYDFHLGMWIASTSMLNKRFGVAAAELDGALYAIGGYNDRRYLTSVERYDPREALWTFVAPLHQKRGGLSAAVLGGKIYAVGGYDGVGFLSSVEVYESRMNCWVEMENRMQLQRAYGSAAVVGDNIFMFGGYSGKQYIQTVERYHVSNGWEIVREAAIGKRSFHAGVVL